ncbi:MAG: hypothetical protein R3C17_12705 [Planctomycetaceae bacterium]
MSFDKALAESTLPERPDVENANNFLISARRNALESYMDDERLHSPKGLALCRPTDLKSVLCFSF